MRGKAHWVIDASEPWGITPAHAGKSRILQPVGRKHEDHPRPCGEKLSSYCFMVISRGSPPPMRGKVWHSRRGWVPSRITPAHAGKSARMRLTPRQTQDHPRPCGEKLLNNSGLRPNAGSPPPMRGKVSASIRRSSKIRITPAHAGKSRQWRVCVHAP